MKTVQTVTMDLTQKGVTPRINAVQDDKYSRDLQLILLENGSPWTIPAGASAIISYQKPDGTGGSYDLLPDGSTAWTVSSNAVKVALAPQVCTAPGIVQLAISLCSGESEITTFTVLIHVQQKPGLWVDSENYHKVQGLLPSYGWKPNMYLGTDEEGNVVEKSAVGNDTPSVMHYDQNVKSVNHRGYSTQAPENTIPAYILSKQMGFSYVECDVSFTADGVAVLLHDDTIDRTSNGSGSISDLTYAQVARYDFGSWKAADYAGTKIPTFGEFIAACKGLCLHPYIELKNNGAYTGEQIAGIVAAVKAHGMQGKVTYISFSSTYLSYVKQADPKARLGYLVSTLSAAAITAAQNLYSGENEVFLDAKLANLTEEQVNLCIAADIPLEGWTVNNESDIETMNPYISGVTSDHLIAGKVLYDRYMVYTPPVKTDIPATAVTLSVSALTFVEAVNQTLTATVAPEDTTDPVAWSSSDNGVASVAGGVVTPVANGSAVITATAGSVSAQCSVTVDIKEPIISYTVTNVLTNVNSSNGVASVLEGTAYTATLTAVEGYELNQTTVTMGGGDITSQAYADGVVTVSAVTGDLVITAAAVEIDNGEGDDTGGGNGGESGGEEPAVTIPEGALINLALSSYNGSGTIDNEGSGGAAYQATVSGSPTAITDGLTMGTVDYFTVPKMLNANTPWTWFVSARIGESSAQKYQRIMRGTNDVPSVYWSTNYSQYGVKLTNSATSLSPIEMSNLGTSHEAGKTNTFGFVCDGTNISLYINGIFYKSEAASQMSANNKVPDVIGCGDTGSQGYYHNSLDIKTFLVYDRALTESEMAALHQATAS